MQLRDAGFVNAQACANFPHCQFLLVVQLDHLALPFRDASDCPVQNFLLLATVTRIELMAFIVAGSRPRWSPEFP